MFLSTEEKAAVVNARCATAMIRAMGMQAENSERIRTGHSIKYGEKAFESVIEQEGTHWNAVAEFLYH